MGQGRSSRLGGRSKVCREGCAEHARAWGGSEAMGCGCVDASREGLSWGCEAGARLGQQQFLSHNPASPVGSWETQGWLG